jgi:hypothetical protein
MGSITFYQAILAHEIGKSTDFLRFQAELLSQKLLNLISK